MRRWRARRRPGGVSLLLLGYDEEFESAAQAVAIADDGAEFHELRRKGDGELQRYDFAGVQLAAEGCADAVLADFVGSAPAGGGCTVAKHRDLDARVKAITGEAAQSPLRFGRRLSGGSIDDLHWPVFRSNPARVLTSGKRKRERINLCLLFRSCFIHRFVLNGIKGHVPTRKTAPTSARLATIAHVFLSDRAWSSFAVLSQPVKLGKGA